MNYKRIVGAWRNHGTVFELEDGMFALVDHELSVSIPAKSLDITNLSITSKGVNMWSILVTVLLPLTILITGAVVCFRRRKR